MREEVAQFVVANRDPELPAITKIEAMRCVPRDGVKWGKMMVNGECITASWAYHSEKYQRRANYVRVRALLSSKAFYCSLTLIFDHSITSSSLIKMFSDRRFTMAVSTRYGHCK